jgi:L-cysteine desulfidase
MEINGRSVTGVDRELLLDVLKSEIDRSVGCTDPGAVCLAVHEATRALGARPGRIRVTVSQNIYKNGINVGVPGTGMRGLHIAAALGAVLGPGVASLSMLDRATQDDLAAARELVSHDRVTVEYAETPDPLYIRAEVTARRKKAHAIISGDYTSITEIMLDGRVLFAAEGKGPAAVSDLLTGCSLEQLFVAIGEMSLDELSFLVDAAAVNRQAALAGLESPASSRLGSALCGKSGDLPAPVAAALHAQRLTAAACEARMSGLPVPVMAIAGSGNHGIANFLGILGVAETLGSTPEQTARALAISSTVTVVIKGHASRLSAFCGCAVAAAAGVAAGTVYLLGGSYADSVNAMQSVIGTLAGMVCDGAKESCAFKLSSSVALAVQFSYLALEGACIPAGMGILGGTIEKTFENLGQLNNPGMVTADRLMLRMISGSLS